MTTITKREARPRYAKRPSGWIRWSLQDSMGCELTHPTITTSGMEKAKNKAEDKARQAAREFNAQSRVISSHRASVMEKHPMLERKEME